jgi:hypothetical protein
MLMCEFPQFLVIYVTRGLKKEVQGYKDNNGKRYKSKQH